MPNDAQLEIQNDPDLYFDDGNVVFQVENTRFRLYRGIIAARSSVFRDIFSVPQPQTQDGLVDGCIVIHLPDQVKYVRIFFLAIYDLGFFHPYPSPTTVETVTGILAMSHKYDSPVLFQRALKHLSYSFPCTFDVWVGKSEDEYSIIFPSLTDDSDTSPAADALLELAAMVYITNTTWILPVLLDHLRQFPLINIVGSLYWKSDALDESVKRNIIVGYSSHLDYIADIKRLVISAVPAVDCTTHLKCLRHASQFFHMRDITTIKKEDPNSDSGYYNGDCKKCEWFTSSTVVSCRREIWMNMPNFYSLPSWEELRGMEAAVRGT